MGEPQEITQQALSLIFLTFPAIIFEKNFKYNGLILVVHGYQ